MSRHGLAEEKFPSDHRRNRWLFSSPPGSPLGQEQKNLQTTPAQHLSAEPDAWRDRADHREAAMKRFAAPRLAIFVGAIALAGKLPAQDATPASSREETYALQQAEKARTSQPPKHDRAEELVRKAEDLFLVDPSGFFPVFDSVYQGGGLTVGGGYRKFYGDNSFWQVKGLYSVLNYKLAEGAIVSRDHWNKRLTLGTRLGWRDATQVAYYGIGQQSKPED